MSTPKVPPSPNPPTLGSKVRYLSRSPQPAARVAVVTEVLTSPDVPVLVNLCVFNSTGIEFVYGIPYGTQPGEWSWLAT